MNMNSSFFDAKDRSFMSYWHFSKKKTFVCSPDVPGLMQYDWEKETFIPVAQFPEGCRERASYAHCTSYKDKVICFPSYKSNIILFYNLKTSKFTQIPVTLGPNHEGAQIFGAYWHEGYVYAVLYGTRKVLELDPENERIVQIFELDVPEQDMTFVFSTIVEDAIYFTVNSPSKVIRFSIENKAFEILPIPSHNVFFRAIASYGECLVLGGYKKEIYLWNPMSLEFQTICLPAGVKDSGRDDFYNYEFFCTDIVDINKIIVFLSLHESGLFIFDPITNKVELIKLPENRSMRNIKSYTKLYVKDNRFIMLYSLVDERMIEVDVEKKVYRIVCPQIDGTVLAWIEKPILFETGLNLMIFHHTLFSNHFDKKPKSIDERSVGETIWRHIVE